MEDYTKRLEKNIQTGISNVFDGHIVDFIKIMSRFPTFDYKNQLLILRQSPNATYIAGAEAYKAKGRMIKPDSPPILLLYPHFELLNYEQIKANKEFKIDTQTGEKIPTVHPEFSVTYNAVAGYDITNTTGAEDESLRGEKRDLTDALLENDICVMPVDASDLGANGRYKNGIITNDLEFGYPGVSQPAATFAVDRQLQGLQYQNKLISMFCTYATDMSMEEDELLGRLFDKEEVETLARDIIILTAQQYFGSDIDAMSSALSVRFEILKSLSDEDKVRFIKRISKDSSDAIMALDEYVMSFYDIAFANYFIRNATDLDDKPALVLSLLKYMLHTTADDEDVKLALSDFIRFIEGSTTEFIKKIYDLIKKGQMYTYPLIQYELR